MSIDLDQRLALPIGRRRQPRILQVVHCSCLHHLLVYLPCYLRYAVSHFLSFTSTPFGSLRGLPLLLVLHSFTHHSFLLSENSRRPRFSPTLSANTSKYTRRYARPRSQTENPHHHFPFEYPSFFLPIMFGFHSRSRSLIPVGDMEKMEKHAESTCCEEVDTDESEPQTPRQRRNLSMIYLLFLAEAIMAASLSSQINVIFPSNSTCLDMNTSFLRSILQCAYYFGSASGIMWGFVADRLGRRKVALAGLFGMATCCLSMGFATSFTAFCILRYLAGAISAAATVSGLAMLADATHGSKRRTQVIARIPLVVVCGQLGPLLSNAIREFAQEHMKGLFAEFPGLGGQIACSLLVFSITMAELFMLEEVSIPNSIEDESY